LLQWAKYVVARPAVTMVADVDEAELEAAVLEMQP
jgi:hypothetical protein